MAIITKFFEIEQLVIKVLTMTCEQIVLKDFYVDIYVYIHVIYIYYVYTIMLCIYIIYTYTHIAPASFLKQNYNLRNSRIHVQFSLLCNSNFKQLH